MLIPCIIYTDGTFPARWGRYAAAGTKQTMNRPTVLCAITYSRAQFCCNLSACHRYLRVKGASSPDIRFYGFPPVGSLSSCRECGIVRVIGRQCADVYPPHVSLQTAMQRDAMQCNAMQCNGRNHVSVFLFFLFGRQENNDPRNAIHTKTKNKTQAKTNK